MASLSVDQWIFFNDIATIEAQALGFAMHLINKILLFSLVVESDSLQIIQLMLQ